MIREFLSTTLQFRDDGTMGDLYSGSVPDQFNKPDHDQQSGGLPARPISPFAREAVYHIKSVIDDQPLLRRNISHLVNQAQVGRNILQDAFKQMMGKTIKRYRLEKRMEAARDMLEQGKFTIQQVSLKCGYKKQNNFSADFKKVFNMPPKDWIRKLNSWSNNNITTIQ